MRHCRLHLFAFVLENSHNSHDIHKKKLQRSKDEFFGNFFARHTHTYTSVLARVWACSSRSSCGCVRECVCAAFAFALFAAVSVVVIILQTDFPFLAGYGAYARYGDSLLLFVACSMWHAALTRHSHFCSPLVAKKMT